MFCAGGLLRLLSPVLAGSKSGYGTGVLQADLVFPTDVFLRVDVYAAVFVCVLLLNLLSSLIPVLRAVRSNVTDSLNEKK